VNARTTRTEGECDAALALWAAARHKWGEGKVHIVDPESAGRPFEERKTMCGHRISMIAGSPATEGEATCMGCVRSLDARAARARREAEWAARSAEYEAQRAEENRQWWERYDDYLQSPEWAEKRRRVLERANHICEGCAAAPAVQVHHLTYQHVGDELLWELRAVCLSCHERAHSDRSAA
jgi:5-methylcytosine-specific restriction endonuclease McrA